MSVKTGFEDFAEILLNMPLEKKRKLIESHQEFGRLRSWCEAKGMIEILPKMTGIKVLKKTKEVRKLKKLIDILQPGRFKWEDGSREPEN